MKRTKACKNCGEVIFSINSTCEDVEFICKNCKTVNIVSLSKYCTIENKCNSCSSDSFKIKVNDNDKKEQIIAECSKCKRTPSIYFVDKNGIEIDRIVREMLIIQDSIEIINKSVSTLESRIGDVEDDLKYIKYDKVENLSRKINENKIDINSINYDMSNFSGELSELKNIMENIERSMMSNLYLFK